MTISAVSRPRFDSSTGAAGRATGTSGSALHGPRDVNEVQLRPSHQRSGAIPHGSRYHAAGGSMPGVPGPMASPTPAERSGRAIAGPNGPECVIRHIVLICRRDTFAPVLELAILGLLTLGARLAFRVIRTTP